MSLFQYTYRNGTTVSKDIIEHPENITELIFLRDKDRFATDKIRPHESHPVHEAAAKAIPPHVRILRAIGCKLRTFPVLPTNIHECYLSSNHFLALPDLSAYAQLIVLELDDNSIAAVDRPLPPTLARLNLDCNAIRRFNQALVPRSCVNISTSCNPYDPYGFVLRRGAAAGAADEPAPATVYLNDHNIHDSGVQKSTKANILYIVNYKPDVPACKSLWDDIDKAYGVTAASAASNWMRNFVSRIVSAADTDARPTTPGSILKSYAQNPYIMHGVTFEKLVDRIWLRIKDTADEETRTELMRRFREEVEEGNGHCTNGMMVRLVNVFLGFDEHIVVKLNPNQVLGARIPATMERLRKSMNLEGGAETNEYWLACYNETIKDLEELDVGKVIRDGDEIVDTSQYETWLLPLVEQVLDKIFTENGWHLLSKSQRLPLRPVVGAESGQQTVSEFLMKAGLHAYEWELNYIADKWRAIHEN